LSSFNSERLLLKSIISRHIDKDYNKHFSRFFSTKM